MLTFSISILFLLFLNLLFPLSSFSYHLSMTSSMVYTPTLQGGNLMW